ncbi:hypothetical protein LAUMK136_05188 [Mycobacterium attenuatum]|uniref:Uncharacterized protein n=1 Tax=Mycobacterium attenuatum TaxID=2341086 RepID=A0A498QBF0_9MYCO|nr:hypothetical protein [Mycobacterium attenuatum]VBA43608.1 hypothetical protein LAUMK136_05188 [Mycobacterium attenuatum]
MDHDKATGRADFAVGATLNRNVVDGDELGGAPTVGDGRSLGELGDSPARVIGIAEEFLGGYRIGGVEVCVAHRGRTVLLLRAILAVNVDRVAQLRTGTAPCVLGNTCHS